MRSYISVELVVELTQRIRLFIRFFQIVKLLSEIPVKCGVYTIKSGIIFSIAHEDFGIFNGLSYNNRNRNT